MQRIKEIKNVNPKAMKKSSINFLFIIISVILLSSCAGPYHAISPGQISYYANSNIDELDFSYKYNVMIERRNKKYARKEVRSGMNLVAVRITNKSSQKLVVKDDITFYSNGQPFIPMEPKVYTNTVKQQAGFYLFYLLLTPISLNTYDEYGNTESSTPIGLFIGPGIALGNLIGASQANQNMLREIERENIINKTIEPGQSVSGLMVVPGFASSSLTIDLND